ncbi:MAG: acetyl-CoA C-acyltransferase [Methylacidiphilales bacterium]|nr:acetyl-CoA C-acyltransferase [Candidatus Methylacidiphilales bacterium]
MSLIEGAFICDYQRTAIGRYNGSLASVRPDDLLAITIQALMTRNPSVDWSTVSDVLAGCANQAGEDNRCVARMAVLLSGLPISVSATTINRLCASGMDAVAFASASIKAQDGWMFLAGGVESMTRAPFVLGKSPTAFSREATMYDTTIGWRFINKKIAEQFGTLSMPETGEEVAKRFAISRERQDEFAFASQQKYAQSFKQGRFAEEITPVKIPSSKGGGKGGSIDFLIDEHPRQDTSLEKLQSLSPLFTHGTVTAGNASGVNDGAAMTLLANQAAIKQFSLNPIAQIVAVARSGVEPNIMGIGPRDACRALIKKTGLSIDEIDLFEINEAFASQVLACLSELGISDNDPRVNPNGGAIALGHPLGMSGTRLIGTLALELKLKSLTYGIATMCVGVGQGVAVLLKKV